MNNEFQEFTIDFCLDMVNRANMHKINLLSTTYSYPLRSAIDRYAMTYHSCSKQKAKHVYIKNFTVKDRVDTYWYDKCLFTESGWQIFTDTSLNQTQTRNLLQGEHITPMSHVQRRLAELAFTGNIDRKLVADAFNFSKYFIIAKDEADNILDKAGSRYTQEIINDFINCYLKVDPADSLNIIPETNKLLNKSTESHGHGLIRSWLLLNAGSDIVDITGRKLSFKEIINYLTNNDYEL